MYGPAFHPAAYRPPNPGYGYARALLGGGVGALTGTALGQAIALQVAPPPAPKAPATQSEAQWAAYRAEVAHARHVSNSLVTALGTLGAVAGAAAAARPEDRAGAAMGTAAGTLAGRGVASFAPASGYIGEGLVLIALGTALVPLGTAAGIAVQRRRGRA